MQVVPTLAIFLMALPGSDRAEYELQQLPQLLHEFMRTVYLTIPG